MLAPGTMVGGYRIDRLLGEGGMGTVYAASEPTIGKRVAIKVLRAALTADASTKARFEREARAVNAVRHPAVVEVFAFGQLDDGSPYFVMSLLEGRSLRAELEEKRTIEPAEAWRILREVADALATAHAHGVVHRDLKPDNVFLESLTGKAPRPRVLDFGIAKVLDLGALGADQVSNELYMKLTATGAPIGSPTYMAPEQWWNEPTVPQTDQYAFGIMLFEVLTGRPPFQSKQFAEILQLHIHSNPPRLRDAGFAASSDIEELVAKLMAKAPSDRFSDFAAVIEAGDRAFGALARPTEELASGATFSPTSSEISPAASVDSSSSRRSPEGVSLEQSGLSFKEPRALTAAGTDSFAVTAGVIVIIGFAAIYAVGYAGSARRDVVVWIENSGISIFAVLAAFPVALALLVSASRLRRVDTSPRYAPFFIALLPLIPAALSTYTGWLTVLKVVDASPGQFHGFEILNEGMFEASTARFLGFALTAILLLVVSAMFGVTPSRASETSLSIERLEKAWSVAAAVGLASCSATFAVVNAPSAALVLGAGALTEAIAFYRPTTHVASAHRDARDRAISSGAAILLVVGLALSRVEAREAIVWASPLTRAGRVSEIVGAAREREITFFATGITLITFVLIEVFRERRLRGRETPTRAPASAWVLAALLLSTALLDVTLHQRFFAERGRRVEALREQFALFAELDPPTSESAILHEPSPAPALQITTETVAANGKRLAKLGALDSPTGRSNIGRDLETSLARDGAGTDVTLFVDRAVPWSRVLTLLELACDAGARRAEILFTRGDTPDIPRGAPPEAGELLPRDFGALDVTLDDRGFRDDPSASFALVASRILSAAGDGRKPLSLNLGCGRVEK